ncbi:FUSC family protein [Neokomagataea anthophila]|uniref:FUSC family protein n=1 Tax=Neokomagataea anthophila TaxID=2826925 RepID=A0ABS5E9Q7_9PROT|nr:FUSC family protein [Neokomagataea anthophila]MBR0560640.1 FUSC family protein [Neokomagataea anthophila]
MSLFSALRSSRNSPQLHKPFFSLPLRWLFSPSRSALLFALRNTVASLLALMIALWMELDSPAWAAMTVWAVAQPTRGESQSKAKWRIIGTFFGAIASIAIMGTAPQAPWLFFPMIAVWIGLCSGLATFFSNFRAYALVLAGYTCSIICMDAASDPNHVFIIAVSRTTYITLGVLCEAFVALIFAASQEQHAREQIRQKIQSALILVTQTLGSILGEDRGALNAARRQFGTLLQINDQIEFAEVEMGPHGHEGDHARAALASVSALLSRGFGMAMRLQLLNHEHEDFSLAADEVLVFLKEFPKRLADQNAIPDLLAELQHLRDVCHQYAAPHEDNSIIKTSKTPLRDDATLDERVLFISLGDLMGDLERAIAEYEASTHSIPGDHFHFQRETHLDPREALSNGLRGALAVLLTALIYEVTAWPNGLGFIAITTLVCGLFATTENPALGTMKFLKGALAAFAVAWVLTFILIPRATTSEILLLFLAPAMFACGLAKANPSTAGGAGAYGLLLPAMINPQNHHILDEIAFYNSSTGIMMSVIISVLVFRTILPFNPSDERLRLRLTMLSELRALATLSHTPSRDTWIGRNTDRFARLIRHVGPSHTELVEAYIMGTLTTLTLGLNIIRLRTLLDREFLPESARRPIQLTLHYIEYSTRHHDKAARIAETAVRRLRVLTPLESDFATRLDLTKAIAYLVVVAHSLRTTRDFLDSTQLFMGEKTRRQLAQPSEISSKSKRAE